MLPIISVIVYPGVSVDGAPLVESALAELLGLDGQVGTLEVGKRADLLAVAGNPLQGIESLKNVRLVISGGVEVMGRLISPRAR